MITATTLSRTPTEDPLEYATTSLSYKRYTAKESHFKRAYMLRLLRAFDCRCAACGAEDNGLELDHFFVPKAKGGTFVLTYAISNTDRLNAMPLCITCNRDKKDHPASVWLSREQIDSIWVRARDLDAEIHRASMYRVQWPEIGPDGVPVRYANKAKQEAYRRHMAPIIADGIAREIRLGIRREDEAKGP